MVLTPSILPSGDGHTQRSRRPRWRLGEMIEDHRFDTGGRLFSGFVLVSVFMAVSMMGGGWRSSPYSYIVF